MDCSFTIDGFIFNFFNEPKISLLTKYTTKINTLGKSLHCVAI